LTGLIDYVTNLALGAAGAFWFSHYVWGHAEAAKAAAFLAVIWIPGMLVKLWRDRKLSHA
jgi:hypothetical protein